MSDVRVNPPSVRQFGSNAQDLFGQIRASLDSLVNDVVTVDYYGPNAIDFKTKSGQLATELANALIQDLGRISDAVRTSTTNIAASLGGGPVDIQFNGTPVNPPAVPQGDEAVGANLPALEGLKGTVQGHFSAISENFSTNLSNLQGTDWVGTAKENAVGAVSSFTNGAKGKVDETAQRMQTYIAEQLESINRADK